jgi:hypothetical protein
LLLSDTKIAIQQRYLGETKLKVVVLLSRVKRDKTLGEIAIPNSKIIAYNYVSCTYYVLDLFADCLALSLLTANGVSNIIVVS